MYPNEDDPFDSLRIPRAIPTPERIRVKPPKPAAPAAAAPVKVQNPPAAAAAPPKPQAVAGPVEFRGKCAGEICQAFALSPPAQELLGDGLMNPWQFLRLLMEKAQYPDAAQFLAHALPSREGTWWGCLCARQAHGAKPPPPAEAALQAAEKWVRSGIDEDRRAAFPAAEAAGVGTPAGCAALAAFWSGGSLSPAHLDAVPPKPFLGAIPVAGAAMLATVLSEPHKAPEKYLRFLALGIQVATGANRWNPEPTTNAR
jgi:hypothetical protein